MAISSFGVFPPALNSRWLELGHPLLEDAAIIHFPGQSWPELVGNRQATSRAGSRCAQDIYGLAATVAQGSSNGIKLGSFYAIANGQTTYTIACLAKPPAVARRTQVFSQYTESDTGNPQLSLAMNSTSAGTATSGSFAYIEYQSGFKSAAGSTGVPIDGNWHVFGATRNGTGKIVYLDGTDVTSAPSLSGSNGTISGVTPSVTICGQQGSDRACDYPVSFVMVWNRALSALEHAVFAANPWQIFAAPQAFVMRHAYVTSVVAPSILQRRTMGARVGSRQYG